jgi:hypothetical protein
VAVLLPNPRGSTGWGAAFAEANRPDMGGEDLHDILAEVEHCVAQGLADPDRPRRRWLELRRLHGRLGGDPDRPLQGGADGGRERQLAELPRHEQSADLGRALLPGGPLRDRRAVRPLLAAHACGAGPDAAFALSWALRHALFAEGRNVALRHELLAAAEANLDLARFEDDWDRGRHKLSVVDDSRRGWEELRVGGSPTFVLPDGRPVTNPAAGAAEFDEERFVLRRYVPYAGDPRTAYRSLLTAALQHRGPGGG